MFGRNYNSEVFKDGGYIGITQLNPKVGDFAYNSKKISECIKYAEALQLDMVIFPKLALIGYPYNDLLNRHSFLIDENLKWLNGLAKITKKTSALVGFIDKNLKESIAILKNGKIEKIINNNNINSYYEGVNIVCDAIPSKLGTNLENKSTSKPAIFVNQVGAVDDLSFEGASFCTDKDGKIIARAKSYEEDFIVVNPKIGYGIIEPLTEKSDLSAEFNLNYESDLERTYKTILQAIKDYFGKCGLKRAVLGLSGGLDSTVCAVLLTDALGKENVVGVSMPSKLTSTESKSDAKQLAENLGIHFAECSIKPMFDTTTECLEPLFKNIEETWNNRYQKSFTPDNIQARARATYLWCISNEFPSCIPIATSDKSELYMGYATINGDMSGGYAPIADVTKTKLFALARWLNKNRKEKNAIPESVILKRPGAELAIDPKTGKTLCAEDALMPYEFLDEVIWRIENKNESYSDMLDSAFYYEKKNNISKEQKVEWLDKFYKRMSVGGYKWSIMPPSVLTDTHSVNKFDYRQPITSCGINYKGNTQEEIDSILNSN